MPSRRTTLIGLGILTAGGTGAVATGAFSAATAERNVDVGFSGDSQAILSFQPSSNYAEYVGTGTAQELQINFEGLSQRANFLFEDTFIIVNNGTDTVSLQAIGSDEGSNEWRNEDANQPVGVLVGSSVNTWQGTPRSDDVTNADPSVVESGDGENTGGGHSSADTSAGFGITLSPPGESDNDGFGDWVSIGFEFGRIGTDEEVGGWEESYPETLRFEFGQDE